MRTSNSFKLNDWQLFILKKVTSTMDEIKKECYKSNLNTLLMAYTQTTGRGRNHNTWVSNLGNLFLSIKLNTLKMPNPLILNYITGIVVYDTIKFFLEKNNNLYIKWPNDLLINKKKVAGILIDSISRGNKISELYVGIGINVKIAPSHLDYETTCLKNESTITITRKKLLSKLIFYFNYWENVFKKNNFLYISNCWMKRSLPINSKISFKKNKKIISGIYKGISETGSIRILIDNKECNFFNLETTA
jgi:BirA family biotin operon repressor/biotin-[acetyl-CoA-carboxylase] ligase